MVLFSDDNYKSLETDVKYLKKIVSQCFDKFAGDDLSASHVLMQRLRNATDSIDRGIRECQR